MVTGGIKKAERMVRAVGCYLETYRVQFTALIRRLVNELLRW